MYRHKEAALNKIEATLTKFTSTYFPLPGIEKPSARRVFAMQVLDSMRRVAYVGVVAGRKISPRRGDPSDEMFDPVKAAMLALRSGDMEEACWLAFLFVHFGMHRVSRWRFLREVYGRLGATPHWSWSEVSADPEAFRDWLRENQAHLLRGNQRGFGNHRKYQSIDADKPAGTGAAIVSYVDWVAEHGGHAALFEKAYSTGAKDDYSAFDYLYESMNSVVSFGRTAKFDFLTMLSKLGIASIKPPKAYIAGSTGPETGARLMLQGSVDKTLPANELEARLRQLADELEVNMQVIEDSLCNWQKSTDNYHLFSG
ncbi:MAG: hypothetical protein ACJ8LG_24105 [Massilia sp.]